MKNTPHRNVRLKITLPPHVAAALAIHAQAEHRTKSQQIEHILKEKLASNVIAFR